MKTSLAIENRPVEALVPYARNARTHTDAQVAQIAASIREFGWVSPILIDQADSIIAGHGRVLAARKLGMTEVPAIVLDYLSDAQKRALRLADNRLPLSAAWDDELLALELQELGDLDFDLELTGFSLDEIGALTARAGATRHGLTDEDEAPEPPAEPVTRPGDLWIMGGKHRLLCGDATVATDVERVLGGVSPHLLVSDPPYGVEYDPTWRERYDQFKRHARGKVQNDDKADWTEAWSLFPGNIAYVWHGGLHSAAVQASLEIAGFTVRAQIIWVKQHFVFSRGDYHWQHEPCAYAVKGTGKWCGDRKQTTVWNITNHNPMGGKADDTTSGHGTQKPVECMRRPIENNSSPGQAVYDPFMGSGTTIIAAETTGRAAIGLDIDSAYVDVAVKRWQSFTGKEAILESDGRTFREIEAERLKVAA